MPSGFAVRAVITGAASGIGRAVARLLAERGEVHLLLVDRDAAPLNRLVYELRARGAAVFGAVADLADPASPAAVMLQAQAELRGLDALISNAGVLHAMPVEAVGSDEFDRMFAVNVRATLLLAQAALPMLKADRGSIVATASISSEHPTPGAGLYAASKAALAMLMRQMALEWGPYGIRCNCVSPGPTHTGMTAAAYDDVARRDRRAQDMPLRRVGQPEDLARAIAFLAGPEASFVTGVNLVVDGGLTLTTMVSASSAAAAP